MKASMVIPPGGGVSQKKKDRGSPPPVWDSSYRVVILEWYIIIFQFSRSKLV